jgi:hypothetical protein
VYRAPTKILSLTLLACAPDFPPEIWSGEHLVYATDRDDLICEGSFHLQDRFVAALAELVGVRLDEPVLFVYVEQSRLGEFCVIEDASGCARHDAVISIWPVSHHELTHAVTRVAGWGGPASFVEGVAEAFNNGLDLAQEQAPLAEVLDGFQFSKPHYFTMGRFVRFLIERHELAAVGAFMRATKYDERRVDYEAAFAEHFGEPLSEAVLAFESYPACSEWNNRIAARRGARCRRCRKSHSARIIGTKRTPPSSRRVRPAGVRVSTMRRWSPAGPTGATRRPPRASCSMSAGGISGGAAVSRIAA